MTSISPGSLFRQGSCAAVAALSQTLARIEVNGNSLLGRVAPRIYQLGNSISFVHHRPSTTSRCS